MSSITERLGRAFEQMASKKPAKAEVKGKHVSGSAAATPDTLVMRVGQEGHTIITVAHDPDGELPPFTMQATSEQDGQHLTSHLSNRK